VYAIAEENRRYVVPSGDVDFLIKLIRDLTATPYIPEELPVGFKADIKFVEGDHGVVTIGSMRAWPTPGLVLQLKPGSYRIHAKLKKNKYGD
jgi:hypothetical protein